MRLPCLVACVIALVPAPPAVAQAATPTLSTNQAYIEQVTRTTQLAIDDPMAVFAYVLGSLPDAVKVYPTENHYYFAFVLSGVRYAGNIKVDAQLRAQGKIAFTYYEDRGPWLSDAGATARILGREQGVTVEERTPLSWRIAYGDKSVVFALNDLSQVKPPAEALGPDDQFIGPIFDESAVRFFLLFNRKLKIFHYVLDETVAPADTFVPAPVGGGRILIGKRTGFALYRDRQRDRKIMIGAYAANVAANNYFDGPFDQMPDNFLAGDSLRDAMTAAEPGLRSHINRYGGFVDGGRFAIQTYMEYRSPKDLAVFDRCATRAPAARYAACFSLPLEGEHGPTARPLALSHPPG